jgi:hypothetical protein
VYVENRCRYFDTLPVAASLPQLGEEEANDREDREDQGARLEPQGPMTLILPRVGRHALRR